jgi:hypothetical protein
MNLTKESIVEWASSWVPEANRDRFAAALRAELDAAIPAGDCEHHFIQRDGILNTRICTKCGERRRKLNEAWEVEPAAPSPLGGLADVIAEYDRITANADRFDAEWDFVMRASDWRVLRAALLREWLATSGPFSRTNHWGTASVANECFREGGSE